MGCGGSRDTVVELPKGTPRRSSLPCKSNPNKIEPEGLFSRPGSGPIVLAPESRGRKNRIGIENNTSSPRSNLAGESKTNESGDVVSANGDIAFNKATVLPRIESQSKVGLNEELRKGSAQSKASQDSGIGLDQMKTPLAVLPPTAHSSPALSSLDAKSGNNCSASPRSSAVPRLASEDILSQLNEIGIVPLRTSRCGSSLAFNIELDPSRQSGSNEKLDESVAGNERSLPPLPPTRIQRLQALPPIQTSMEQLESKQKKAEQRRKNREERVRLKSEKLRQRRVSEAEQSEREEDLKEKFSQDIQAKLAQSEFNKQKLKEQQEEKRRKNEERLKRVRLNKEKLMNGGGYGDKFGSENEAVIETDSMGLERSCGLDSSLDESGLPEKSTLQTHSLDNSAGDRKIASSNNYDEDDDAF